MRDDRPAVPYDGVFAATPAPLLVLTPDLVIIRDAADAYLAAVGRSREELLGRYLFDVFPGSATANAQHVADVRASLERVRDTGRPDTMVLQRFDIPAGAGTFVERYWNAVHVPVPDAEGRVVLLLQRTEDVTDYVRARQRDRCSCACTCDLARSETAEWDVFARAVELQSLNAELRARQDQLTQRVPRLPHRTADPAGHPRAGVTGPRANGSPAAGGRRAVRRCGPSQAGQRPARTRRRRRPAPVLLRAAAGEPATRRRRRALRRRRVRRPARGPDDCGRRRGRGRARVGSGAGLRSPARAARETQRQHRRRRHERLDPLGPRP